MKNRYYNPHRHCGIGSDIEWCGRWSGENFVCSVNTMLPLKSGLKIGAIIILLDWHDGYYYFEQAHYNYNKWRIGYDMGAKMA